MLASAAMCESAQSDLHKGTAPLGQPAYGRPSAEAASESARLPAWCRAGHAIIHYRVLIKHPSSCLWHDIESMRILVVRQVTRPLRDAFAVRATRSPAPRQRSADCVVQGWMRLFAHARKPWVMRSCSDAGAARASPSPPSCTPWLHCRTRHPRRLRRVRSQGRPCPPIAVCPNTPRSCAARAPSSYARSRNWNDSHVTMTRPCCS